MILVTGATGNNGKEIVKRLSERRLQDPIRLDEGMLLVGFPWRKRLGPFGGIVS